MAFDFEKDNADWNQQIDYGPTWPKSLLVFVLVLFGLSIALKFGFDFLTSRQQVVINDLERQVAQAKNTFPIENQNIIIDFQRGIQNVKHILANKVSASAFLMDIANNTHKDIYFNYLNSNIRERNVEIGGFARSNEVIVQAVLALENIEGVESVVIRNTRNIGSGVSLILSLVVRDLFYR